MGFEVLGVLDEGLRIDDGNQRTCGKVAPGRTMSMSIYICTFCKGLRLIPSRCSQIVLDRNILIELRLDIIIEACKLLLLLST